MTSALLALLRISGAAGLPLSEERPKMLMPRVKTRVKPHDPEAVMDFPEPVPLRRSSKVSSWYR